MKKVTFEELGEYFGEKATNYFGREYSKDIEDYRDNLGSEPEYLEDEDIYECHIELTEVGKAPLVIEYYEKAIEAENGAVDTEYYI